MHLILVVDDNVDSCEALARLLTRLGNKATCVDSGQAALDYLEHHKPALVILDVMMPGMDGMEVLRRIRANPETADLPVVMFSGIADLSYTEHARSNGATDFWVKSTIDFSRLSELVAPYVGETLNESR